MNNFIERSRTVSFISIELAETAPDLIVAFALIRPDDPFDIDNLILLRTPKYEHVLPINEQGLLRRIAVKRDQVEIYSDGHHYVLDIRKTDPESVELMKKALRKMNFDGNFEMEGV